MADVVGDHAKASAGTRATVAGTARLPPNLVRLSIGAAVLLAALPVTRLIAEPIMRALDQTPATVQLLAIGLSVLAIALFVAYADRRR